LLDRQIGTNFFDPVNGGSALLYQFVFWFYSHPAVYIMILPAFGIISEIIPVFSRKPIFGYKAMAASIAAIAVLGFIVFVHHMFVTGLPLVVQTFFAFTTFVIGVPTGVKIFSWLATMWGGSIKYDTPMLFACGFLLMFLIGGIDGVYLGSLAVDRLVHGTYWVVAHIHYVLFGGSVFGVFGAFYYWFPKVTGRFSQREARQAAFLVDVHRHEPDVPADARPRSARHAEADRDLSRQSWLGRHQFTDHLRRVRHRHLDHRLHDQFRDQHARSQDCTR